MVMQTHSFSAATLVTCHMDAPETPDVIFPCPSCTKTFATSVGLANHDRVHARMGSITPKKTPKRRSRTPSKLATTLGKMSDLEDEELELDMSYAPTTPAPALAPAPAVVTAAVAPRARGSTKNEKKRRRSASDSYDEAAESDALSQRLSKYGLRRLRHQLTVNVHLFVSC